MMTAADVFWTNQTFTSMGRDTGKTLSRSRWRFHYQRRRHRGIGTVVVDCLAAICRRADCADSDSRCHNGSTGTWRVLHVDYMTPTAKQQLMTCIYVVRFLPYCYSDWLMEQKQNMLVHTSIDMTHAAVESNYDEQLSNNTQTHVTLRIHKLWPVKRVKRRRTIDGWQWWLVSFFSCSWKQQQNLQIEQFHQQILIGTHTFFWSFTDLIKCWISVEVFGFVCQSIHLQIGCICLNLKHVSGYIVSWTTKTRLSFQMLKSWEFHSRHY